MSTNIRNGIYFLLLLCSFFLTILHTASGQENKQLKVTDNFREYSEQVRKNGNKRMVELKSLAPSLVYELRYADSGNFMKRRMYPAGTKNTYLRLPAARAIAKIQEELKEQSLGLKIFDAYRPYSVTVKFWELVRDERYVANPAKGSGHNRGIAVDLTIIDLKNGEELDMGTGFDNFTDTAHWSFTQLGPLILKNRELLRKLMEKHGFNALDTEWWHFYLPTGNDYEVLDISFKKFKKKRAVIVE